MSDDRTSDSDDGFSSDDLLRDAKDKFGLDDGSSGVAESLLESSMETDDAAEPMPSIDEIAAELAAARKLDTDSAAIETPEGDFAEGSSDDLLQHSDEGPPEPPHREPTTSSVTRDEVTEARNESLEPDSFRVTIPDPGVPTGLPSERVVVDSDQVIAGLPVPPEASAKAGGLLSTLWRNRWIVVVAVVGISVLAGLLDKSEPISNVAPGDCFNDPSGDTVSDINLIDCSKDHELEAFANTELSGGVFPGDFAMMELAFNSCLDRFESYVGEPYDTSSLYMFPFTPTEDSWNDGEREALCVVYQPVPGSEGNEIMSRSSSVRGSGL